MTTQSLARGVLEIIAQAATAYDRDYPGKPDNWRPAGVLELTIGDLRGAALALAEMEPTAPEFEAPYCEICGEQHATVKLMECAACDDCASNTPETETGRLL